MNCESPLLTLNIQQLVIEENIKFEATIQQLTTVYSGEMSQAILI